MIEIIPAGYQLRVASWENDGDDNRTQIISGLTHNDVKFYLDLARAFMGRQPGAMGNKNNEDGAIEQYCLDVLARHPDISPTLAQRWGADAQDGEGLYYILCDTLLHYPVQYDTCDNFTRRISDIEIFNIESEIRIEYVEMAEEDFN